MRGADPCQRLAGARRSDASIPTSGSSFWATACSASRSRPCSTRFPAAEEGELSRRLADLVRKETCAEVAREWGVGEFLRLGEGEAQTGGAKKTAILGDICESHPRRGVSRRRLCRGRGRGRALLRERMLNPGAAAARSQDRLAGMGAGARPAAASLSPGGPLGPRSRAGIRHGGRGRRLRAARGRGQLQTLRRTGRRPRNSLAAKGFGSRAQ